MEDRRVRLSKKLLKEALVKLLEKKRVDKIKISELCELADVNRSTFYAYYDNIEQLLSELENDILKRIPFSSISQALKLGSENYKDIKDFLDYIKENSKMMKVILLTHISDYSSHPFTSKMYEESGYKDNKIPTTIKYRFLYRVYGFVGVVNDWLINDMPIATSTLANNLLDLLTDKI